MKAYVKLAELKARFWHYSIIQSFCVSNPTLKNGDFGCLFPLYTLLHNRDLTIVSLVGITTRRAETIVRCYELVTAPSYIHTYIEVPSCKSNRKEFHIHDHKGAYARAYATIYFILIVNP